MAKSNIIINELMEISPVVAGLNAEHPYQVPEGYFDRLPGQLLELITSPPEKDIPVLSKDGKLSDPHQVPDGYFDNLANIILNRVNAVQANPSEELDLISPVLNKLDRKPVFSVPDGYFDEMPSNVIAGIKAIDFVEAELEILPSQLLQIQKQNAYTVPSGYFEALPQRMLEMIKPKTKIFSINFPGKVVRYAAAAAIIGIMAIGYILFNKDPEKGLAVNGTSVELDSSIKKISDAEINNYVENSATPLAEASSISNDEFQQEDVHDMLADVSDTDIETYLEENGISQRQLTN